MTTNCEWRDVVGFPGYQVNNAGQMRSIDRVGMTLQVEFVDFTEPTRQDGAERAREFAEILRANPGRWAKWPNPMAGKSARSRASDINSRRIRGCPKALLRGGFEARCRNGELFVRYVGGQA